MGFLERLLGAYRSGGHHGGGHHGYRNRDYADPYRSPPPDSATMNCLKCGARNDAQAKFCGQCGTSVGPDKCVKCNSSLPADARFCGQCGMQA